MLLGVLKCVKIVLIIINGVTILSLRGMLAAITYR